jgi:MoaA/NifB/PqqE/SkfB family radical SAM enzyme
MSKHRRSLSRRIREWRIVKAAAMDQDRPMLAHIVPTRRCNLACGYCNEYDGSSDPVTTDLVMQRVDRLAALGTAVVTISGGEPLLHPDLSDIIRRIERSGMVSTLITNGYLLVPKQIEALNDAKLDRLQISIDNVNPDDTSKKSLKVLGRKLACLAELARFDVNINSVVGAGVERPEDALTIAERALELGFTATMGIIHDGRGNSKPLHGHEKTMFDEFQGLARWSLTGFNRTFQTNLAAGKPNKWCCRAGARFLYICEDGLVHYCSQQRGYPGVPLADYALEDIRREHRTPKSCAPYCTLACVHQASMPDRWRSPQTLDERSPSSANGERLVQLR